MDRKPGGTYRIHESKKEVLEKSQKINYIWVTLFYDVLDTIRTTNQFFLQRLNRARFVVP